MAIKIKLNEVTWYSKLATFIVLLAFFPILAFYIGTQYARTLDVYSSLDAETVAATK